MEPTIKFELPLREVNAILAGLGTLPHNQVAQLFDKIRQIATEQVQAQVPQPGQEPKE